MIPTFYAWSAVSLLEIPLWTALICGLVFVAAAPDSLRHRSLLLGALGAAMIWTRPEALLLAPVGIGLAVLGDVAKGRAITSALRMHAFPLLLTVLSALVLIGFRLAYFGYPLPNTHYAKVSPDRYYNLLQGVKYVAHSLRAAPAVGIVAAASPIVLLFAIHHMRPGRSPASRTPLGEAEGTALVVATMVCAGLLLPLAEGSDHFPWHRLLQPFVPLMVVPAIWLVRSRSLLGFLRPVPAVVLASALVLIQWISFGSRPVLASQFDMARGFRRLGTRMNDLFSSSDALPSLGVIPAGGIAVTYDGVVWDLVGLNWSAMAHAEGDRKGYPGHSAFNKAVFWQTQVDIVSPQIVDHRPARCLRHRLRFREPNSIGTFREQPVRRRVPSGVRAYRRRVPDRLLSEGLARERPRRRARTIVHSEWGTLRSRLRSRSVRFEIGAWFPRSAITSMSGDRACVRGRSEKKWTSGPARSLRAAEGARGIRVARAGISERDGSAALRTSLRGLDSDPGDRSPRRKVTTDDTLHDFDNHPVRSRRALYVRSWLGCTEPEDISRRLRLFFAGLSDGFTR